MTGESVLVRPPEGVGMRIMKDKLMERYKKWVAKGRPRRQQAKGKVAA